MPLKYKALSPELQEKILRGRSEHWVNPWRFDDADVCRRDMNRDADNLWRPAFVRDIEKILHLPVYNRYADKTQVFSFYNNDDITRRALHVQLVSRIARNIGTVLGLNLDLIEAISLGHDLGHTPFGHAGERFLSQMYHEHTGRYFNHNVHSVRVLDTVFRRNISLQTLDGILCHNGEFEMQEYRPNRDIDFASFDECVERCYTSGHTAVSGLVPSTLEGCVVRICDMIAYLGKDRQDAKTARITDNNTKFKSLSIGAENAAIINNLVVDIIENSYGHDYIMLSRESYNDLKTAKNENYEKIYKAPQVNDEYEKTIKPMVELLYEKLLADVKSGSTGTEIYQQHIAYVNKCCAYYSGADAYENQKPDDIVVDYIASMTDDYFIALFQRLFPDSKLKIHYKSYFEEMDK